MPYRPGHRRPAGNSRQGPLNRTFELSLDLRPALHIELASLGNLRVPSPLAGASLSYEVTADLDRVGTVQILLPPVWPTCPVERTLARYRQRKDDGES